MNYSPVDLSKVRTYSLHDRKHKSMGFHKNLPGCDSSFLEFLHSLPDFFGANSFKRVVDEIITARCAGMPVIAAMGGHVVKVGCGPVLIDLIEREIITGIACSGAFAIHDVELALFGKTSEDVAETIHDGSFGMVRETIEFFKEVTDHCGIVNGLGIAIGHLLQEQESGSSVIKTAVAYDIPCCVHVSLGADTIHMTQLDIAHLADASMYDFKLLCDVVSKLGVWLNIGSAVMLPEVFLKAVTVARNLGADLDGLFTANFDMIQHYRTHHNVVIRPVKHGRGVEITGHHEIMLPLLRQALIERYRS